LRGGRIAWAGELSRLPKGKTLGKEKVVAANTRGSVKRGQVEKEKKEGGGGKTKFRNPVEAGIVATSGRRKAENVSGGRRGETAFISE